MSAQSALTCISCHVAFGNVQLHREHYKSDWHRYNLMRKVADLPPISSEIFQQRAEIHKLKEDDTSPSHSNKPDSFCKSCNKYFGTVNALTNHLNSKKHLETEAKSKIQQIEVENKNLKNIIKTQEAARDDILSQEACSSNQKAIKDKYQASPDKSKQSDDEEWNDLDESDWESVDENADDTSRNLLEDLFDGTPLAENECLFCDIVSQDLARCIDHMTTQHSFFIPDVEYLTDLSGLINYLSRKIGAGRMCLWCYTSGLKRYPTFKAVKQHMVDKGHCKMLHDGEAVLEYAPYYDYSSSYPDQDDADADSLVEIPTLDSDDWQLVLPSGATIGHRSLHRYFKQNIKPIKENQVMGKQQASIQRLMHQYRALGYHDTSSKAIKQKAKDLFFVKQMQARHHLKIGLKNHQPHYRPQVLF